MAESEHDVLDPLNLLVSTSVGIDGFFDRIKAM